jgi:hypothetical protein
MVRDGALDGVASCPRCLRPREITGVGESLFWVCACAITPVDPE